MINCRLARLFSGPRKRRSGNHRPGAATIPARRIKSALLDAIEKTAPGPGMPCSFNYALHRHRNAPVRQRKSAAVDRPKGAKLPTVPFRIVDNMVPFRIIEVTSHELLQSHGPDASRVVITMMDRAIGAGLDDEALALDRVRRAVERALTT